MKKLILLILVMILCITSADAKPQYSILQTYGTKCINCHVNMQGGVRSYQGWLSRKDISLIKPSSIGLEQAFEAISSSNTFLDDKLLFGIDFRYQSAKWGPPESAERDQMVMQLYPTLVVTPVQGVKLEASYNFAYDIESLKRYPNQLQYQFSLELDLFDELPSLRAGFFRPSVSTKYDDHTMLIYRTADNRRSLLLYPHDYAEWGAQIDYNKLSWLYASAGVFSGYNMSKMRVTDYMNNRIPLAKENSTSYAFSLSIHPELGSGINTFFGGSLYLNGGLGIGDDGITKNENYMYIASLFFNIGLSDKVALMTEYVTSEKQFAFTTDNFLIELDYQAMESILVYARAERGTTRQRLFSEDYFYNVNQFVFGAQINLLPYIVLLPEYRIYDREAAPKHQSQWAFQLHVFY